MLLPRSRGTDLVLWCCDEVVTVWHAYAGDELIDTWANRPTDRCSSAATCRTCGRTCAGHRSSKRCTCAPRPGSHQEMSKTKRLIRIPRAHSFLCSLTEKTQQQVTCLRCVFVKHWFARLPEPTLATDGIPAKHYFTKNLMCHHHPKVPGDPLNGPTSLDVIHPP